MSFHKKILLLTMAFGLFFSCNSPEKCIEKGEAALRAGDFEKAKTFFQKAIELDESGSGLAWLGLGDAQEGLKERFSAVDAWRKAAKLNSENEEVWLRLSRNELDHSRIVDASTRYIALNRDDPEGWRNRALAYAAKGDWRNAEKDLARWEELESAPADQYKLRGDIHEMKGDLISALKAYEAAGFPLEESFALEALKDRSRDGDSEAQEWLTARNISDSTLQSRAEAAFMKEDYVQALGLFERALKATPKGSPKRALLKANLALSRAQLAVEGHFDDDRRALVNQGRAAAFRRAEAEAKSASEADESEEAAHFALGMIDFYQRLFPTARKHFRKALETANEEKKPEIQYYLAYCEYESREYKTCAELATKAMAGGFSPSEIPSGPVNSKATPQAYLRLLVLRGRARQNLGTAYSDKAFRDLDKAVGMSSHAGWTLKWRGLWYKSKGNYEKAFGDLSLAAERGEKGDPEVFEALKWLAENQSDRRYSEFMDRNY